MHILKSDMHVYLVLGYLALQLHSSWMHNCSLGHPKSEIKLFLKINLLGLGSKWLVSLATRNAILKELGVDLQTQSYLSRYLP